MSQENVELVRTVNEAHDRGDFATVFAAYDPEIEWTVGRLGAVGLDFDPSYVGKDGVRSFWKAWLSAWETTSFDYEEFIDAGEHVVVVMSQRVRGRSSGVELELTSYAQVWTVRDSKLVRSEFFPSRAEALEAVGLAEQAMREELVRRGIQAINDRDLDALLAVMDDEVEAVPLLAAVEGRYHGHDGIRRWWANLLDTFPDFRIEVLQVREIGEATMAVLGTTGRGVGGDTPFEATIWHLSRFWHDKCIQWRVYPSEVEALEAVGCRSR